MICSTRLVRQPFPTEALHGLHAFSLAEDSKGCAPHYCFTASVARVLRVTPRAVAQLVSRHLPAEASAALCVTRASHPDSFSRVLVTYAAVKQQLDGAVDSLNSRKADRFSLYPLSLVAKLLALH